MEIMRSRMLHFWRVCRKGELSPSNLDGLVLNSYNPRNYHFNHSMPTKNKNVLTILFLGVIVLFN